EPAGDIVRRALEASGLEETHEPIAVRYRYKMTEGSDVLLVEAMGDAAGTMSRVTLTEKESGTLVAWMVSHAGKSWVLREHGKAIDLPAEQASMWLAMQHTERVIWLLPLLQDRRFTLTPLGEERAGPRVLHGVRVAYPGQSDVRLYFDRERGLLSRAHFTWKDGDAKTAALVEEFHDYRPIDGGAADVA